MFSGKRFDPLLERRLMQNASLHILKHQACGFIDKPLLLGGGPVLRNPFTVESKHRSSIYSRISSQESVST